MATKVEKRVPTMPSDISYPLDMDIILKLYFDEDWMDEELITGVEELLSNSSHGVEDCDFCEDDLESEDFSDLDWLDNDNDEDDESEWSEMSYRRFNKNKIVYGQ